MPRTEARSNAITGASVASHRCHAACNGAALRRYGGSAPRRSKRRASSDRPSLAVFVGHHASPRHARLVPCDGLHPRCACSCLLSPRTAAAPLYAGRYVVGSLPPSPLAPSVCASVGVQPGRSWGLCGPNDITRDYAQRLRRCSLAARSSPTPSIGRSPRNPSLCHRAAVHPCTC